MVELHHKELALQGWRLCHRPGDSHHKSVWIGAAQATSNWKAITGWRSWQWICARLCWYVVDRVAGGWEASDGQAPRSYTHGKDDVHPWIAEFFDPPNVYKNVNKVDVPKSHTKILWTPIFEWSVVRCGSKNRHPKDVCLKEIEQRAQKINNRHDWKDLYDHLMSTRIFTLIMNKIVRSENYEADGYGRDLNLLNNNPH